MKPADIYATYAEISKDLDAHWHNQGSAVFGGALSRLRTVAEAGCVEAASALAEIFALPGPRYNPEEGYRWYFISYSIEESYSTEFQNERDDSHYLGRLDDFRNESMVNELVDKLGLDRIRQLDIEVNAWLRDHKIFFTDPRDHRTKA